MKNIKRKNIILFIPVFLVTILILLGAFILLVLPKLSSIVFVKKLVPFTVVGDKAQVSYRTYKEKNYKNIDSDNMEVPSFSWIKTANSEAILKLSDFATVILDKNSLVQVQLVDSGAYLVLLKGNSFHMVNSLEKKQHYNVETPYSSAAVKGTDFGVTEGGGYWGEMGETIIIVPEEDHSNMSEEDVPDGPLIARAQGPRTIIARRTGVRWISAEEAAGLPGGRWVSEIEEGIEASYGGRDRNYEVSNSSPNFRGNTWRERAREMRRMIDELNSRRRNMSDVDYFRALAAIIRSYTDTLPGNSSTNADNIDCDTIRNFTIPHSVPALQKLRSMGSVGDQFFAKFGGTQGVENFLNRVCDDNTISPEERKTIKEITQLGGF